MQSEEDIQTIFANAFQHHQEGRLHEAEQAYRKLMVMTPGASALQGLQGTLFGQTAQFGYAERHLQRAVFIAPEHAVSHSNLGNTLTNSGDLKRAEQSYRNSIVLDPGLPDAAKGLGFCCLKTGEFGSAVSMLTRLQRLGFLDHQTLMAQASALEQSGYPDKALIRAFLLVALEPAAKDALTFLADLFRIIGLLTRASSIYRWLINAYPEDQKFRIGYAEILYCVGQSNESLKLLREAIILFPETSEPYTNFGEVSRSLNQYHRALWSHQHGLILSPGMADIYTNLGILQQSRQLYAEAVTAHKQAIILSPGLVEAYSNLASALGCLSHYNLGLIYYKKAHHIDSSFEDAIHGGMSCAAKSLLWEDLFSFLATARGQIAKGKATGDPFPILLALDDPSIHRRSADLHNPERLDSRVLIKSKNVGLENRINLGIYSSDLREHPVFHNLLPCLLTIDRRRFRLTGFSFLPIYEASIYSLFDEIIDVSECSDAEVAGLSRAKGVDIAIDLNGYTAHCRLGIFRLQPAPVVVNFLGYPGTMGGNCHDYIIADQNVIPDEFEPFYSEQVVRLPHFFMPYDFSHSQSEASLDVNRFDYGLPEDAFVFCSFNEFHKISEGIFNAWTRILKASKDAVLWIALRGDLSSEGLLEKFNLRGVDSNRIIIAKRVKNHQEHLARLSLADLMLDTFPYNSHTTACDAVSMGLPILTIKGQSFASRVSASLLRSIGVPELITSDHLGYEEEAVRLASSPGYYRDIRIRLASGLDRLPPRADYARNLESLLSDMMR